jgi:hypothetical protein
VNLSDPASSLKMAGNLVNPIARFRRRPAAAAQAAAMAESVA